MACNTTYNNMSRCKKFENHCYRDYIDTGYCVEVARYIFYLNNLTNVIKLLKYNNYRARSLWCKM